MTTLTQYQTQTNRYQAISTFAKNHRHPPTAEYLIEQNRTKNQSMVLRLRSVIEQTQISYLLRVLLPNTRAN